MKIIMDNEITKDDIRQFSLLLLRDMRQLLESQVEKEAIHPGWLKSLVVRKLMDMSPGSMQNLRVTDKDRFKKILGSYYYNRTNLQNLFNDVTSSPIPDVSKLEPWFSKLCRLRNAWLLRLLAIQLSST